MPLAYAAVSLLHTHCVAVLKGIKSGIKKGAEAPLEDNAQISESAVFPLGKQKYVNGQDKIDNHLYQRQCHHPTGLADGLSDWHSSR